MSFDILKNNVVKAGLCTHCGTCVGLSDHTLKMVTTSHGPIPIPTSQDSGSIKLPNNILDACPGKRINYPKLTTQIFGSLPENWLVGCFRSAYIGFSLYPDIRRKGSSGGIITQILIYLIENGLVDGAIVVRQGKPNPWEAEPIVAESVNDIIDCSQSVYTPVPVNIILGKIKSYEGKLAFVGLPDQVASIRYLQTAGKKEVKNIEYIIGPYVGINMYFEAIKSYLKSNGIKNINEVTELRYREGEWPGYLHIKTRSGRILKAEKFYYNYLLPFYSTKSMLYAVDFTNELTDISAGDAWSPKYEKLGQGFSVVISRSKKGENLLNEMKEKKIIKLEKISIEEATAMHGHMLDFKKRGSFIRLGWRKVFGKKVPEYGYSPKHIPLSRKLVEIIISSIFLIGSTGFARKIVELIPICVLGPLFNSLRKSWKRISKPAKRKGLRDLEFESMKS